jgi:hypothetical protein
MPSNVCESDARACTGGYYCFFIYNTYSKGDRWRFEFLARQVYDVFALKFISRLGRTN